MAIEKKLICFARLAEFERQLAAGNILDYSIVFIQDAKKIWNRGTYYDCSTLTESTISEWGFTKNTGTYSKPSGGIPKSDLASAVQTSLGKADTAIQSTSFGELTDLALVKGFESAQKGTVYALPDEASGDEDDILLSRSSVKTVNGQSIVGSGDITIQGGGSYDDSEIREAISQLSALTDDFNSDIANLYDVKQDTLESGTNIKTINGESILGSGDIEVSSGGVYITSFTVEQFCTGWEELTDEQRNELLNAASQNKIIGMPYGSNNETGYIVVDYNYVLDEYDSSFWRLVLGVIYNGAYYSNSIASNANLNFTITRMTITPFSPKSYSVTVEDGIASVGDDYGYTDNCIFWVDGECTELYIYLEPSEIGKTVRFFTGESCMLELAVPAYWANGEVPTIEPYTHYELSLVANMERVFNAVLTPFKAVE